MFILLVEIPEDGGSILVMWMEGLFSPLSSFPSSPFSCAMKPEGRGGGGRRRRTRRRRRRRAKQEEGEEEEEGARAAYCIIA